MRSGRLVSSIRTKKKKIPKETAMREDGARKLSEGDHRVVSLVIVREVSCYVAAHSEFQAS